MFLTRAGGGHSSGPRLRGRGASRPPAGGPGPAASVRQVGAEEEGRRLRSPPRGRPGAQPAAGQKRTVSAVSEVQKAPGLSARHGQASRSRSGRSGALGVERPICQRATPVISETCEEKTNKGNPYDSAKGLQNPHRVYRLHFFFSENPSFS